MMADGACGIIMGVVWKRAKDGRFNDVGCGAVEVGPNYPSVVVVFILAHRGILVFGFHI
jgi:hypothetical protein